MPAAAPSSSKKGGKNSNMGLFLIDKGHDEKEEDKWRRGSRSVNNVDGQ